MIFFEPKRRYWLKGEVDTETPAQDAFSAQVIREGADATIVTYGPLVPVALAAAEAATEDGRSIEVIDLRSISPIDFDTVITSVQKTGRLIVTHEAPTFGGIGGEIAARVSERAFLSLEAPVIRVGGFHMPYPCRRSRISTFRISTSCSKRWTVPSSTKPTGTPNSTRPRSHP